MFACLLCGFKQANKNNKHKVNKSNTTAGLTKTFGEYDKTPESMAAIDLNMDEGMLDGVASMIKFFGTICDCHWL